MQGDKMKTMIALALLVFVMFSMSFVDVSASRLQVTDVVWGSLMNPEKAIPGDEKIDLVVVIGNIGNKPTCSLTVELGPKLGEPFPFTSWDGSVPISASFQGVLQPGTSTPLIFKINVSKNAKPGAYQADLRVYYRDCTSTSDVLPQSTQLFSVNLVVSPPPTPRIVESKWIVDNMQASVGPSTGQAVLEVYLEAPLDSAISNVEAKLSLPREFRSLTDERYVTATSLQAVPAGGVFRLRFPVVLSDEVQLGRYQLPLEIVFRNKYGTPVKSNLTVYVDVSGHPEIGFDVEIASFRANTISIITYKIYNKGTAPAYNVELNVRSDVPVVRVLQPSYTIGTLERGQSTTIKVPIFIDRAAEPTMYGLFSRITYKDFYGNVKSTDFNMPFVVEEKFRPGFSVRTSTSFIDAASTKPISIVFTNFNPAAVRDVKITIRSTSSQVAITEGDTELIVSSIPSMGSATANIKVLATPAAGDTVVNLRASVEYRDAVGLLVVENFDIALAVNANIDIRLSGVVISPRVVRPGETVDLAGDVVNEGTGLARSVTVEVSGPNPFRPFGEQSTFIGNVNPSQVSAFTLNFRVDESATPGTYPVIVKVIYKNGFGETFEIQRVLQYEVKNRQPVTTVTTLSQPSSIVPDALPIIAVVGVAVFVVLLVALRRRARHETG
ncbi:MAG: hypothetical protein QXY84_00755 [Candidatus Caldarchaeum sp.]